MRAEVLALCWLSSGCGTEPAPLALQTAIRVQVAEVSAPPEVLTRTLRSTAEGVHDVLISAERPGRVDTIYVRMGQEVHRGDRLVALDARLARANVKLAASAVTGSEATVADAALAVDRLKHLQSSTSSQELAVAESNLIRATAALDAARARCTLARIEFEAHTISAPFDGVIALVGPSEGEIVAAGSPLVRLVDTSSVRVSLGLLQSELPRVHLGSHASVRAGGQTADATLIELSPAADPRTHDWRATLLIDEPPFPAGTSVEVQLDLALEQTDEGVVLLPSAAVRDEAVWVVVERKVQPRHVELVAELPEGTLVRGLPPKSRVVEYTSEPLYSGATVVELEAP